VGNVQQPALGDGTYTLFYVGKGSGHPWEPQWKGIAGRYGSLSLSSGV